VAVFTIISTVYLLSPNTNDDTGVTVEPSTEDYISGIMQIPVSVLFGLNLFRFCLAGLEGVMYMYIFGFVVNITVQ